MALSQHELVAWSPPDDELAMKTVQCCDQHSCYLSGGRSIRPELSDAP